LEILRGGKKLSLLNIYSYDKNNCNT